jgi:hypothetical protein
MQKEGIFVSMNFERLDRQLTLFIYYASRHRGARLMMSSANTAQALVRFAVLCALGAATRLRLLPVLQRKAPASPAKVVCERNARLALARALAG